MVKITIDYEKCDGAECGECADACPMEVLIIEGDKISNWKRRMNAVYVKYAWMYVQMKL